MLGVTYISVEENIEELGFVEMLEIQISFLIGVIIGLSAIPIVWVYD